MFKLARHGKTVPDLVQEKPDPEGWNLIGMLDNESGIGNAARANVEAMRSLTGSRRIIAFPSARHAGPCGLPAIHGHNYLHFNPACVPISDLLKEKWFNAVNIGFWAWETTEPPAKWKEYDASMAQIWVPTTFVRESLLNGGFKTPIHIIPHAIKEQSRHRFDHGRPITFLVQFDGHSRFQRKRPDLAFDAIKTAVMRAGIQATLIIKSHHRDSMKFKFPVFPPSIEVRPVDGWTNDAMMNKLWSETDIFVSLSRSEGFGLPQVEAMARGIAVVATNWGGSLDYLTQDNSYPVNVERVEDAALMRDGYFKTGQWALPDLEHGIEQIVRCIDDIRTGRIESVVNHAQATAAKFTPDKMAAKMMTAIANL